MKKMLNKMMIKMILLIVWTVFVLLMIITPLPVGVANAAPDNSDKVVHFFLFGVFAYLLAEVLVDSRISLKSAVFGSFITSLFYSVGCEIIQKFIPSRTMSITDFLAGAVGAAVLLIIFYVSHYRKK
jgi:VanZ family protein